MLKVLTKAAEEQHLVIGELVAFNTNIYSTIHHLDARVAQLEYENAHFRALATLTVDGVHARPELPTKSDQVITHDGMINDDDRSTHNQSEDRTFGKTKRPFAHAFAAEGVSMSGKTKYRKNLQVKIPGNEPGGPPEMGLATPMASVSEISDGRYDTSNMIRLCAQHLYPP